MSTILNHISVEVHGYYLRGYLITECEMGVARLCGSLIKYREEEWCPSFLKSYKMQSLHEKSQRKLNNKNNIKTNKEQRHIDISYNSNNTV